MTKNPVNRIEFSVIIPFQNGSSSIERALSSVLSQTKQVKDVIVVENGSTSAQKQSLVAVLKDFPSVRLFETRVIGQSYARNYGANQAQGTHLLFLDQDDYFETNFVENIYARLLESPDCNFVFTDFNLVDTQGKIIQERFRRTQNFELSVVSILERGAFCIPSSFCIQKDLFVKISGFDDSLIGFEDDHLVLRVLQAGHIFSFIDSPLSNWTQSPGSASFSLAFTKSRILFLSKVLSLCSTNVELNIAKRKLMERVGRHLFVEYAHHSLREDLGAKSILSDLQSEFIGIIQLQGYRFMVTKFVFIFFIAKASPVGLLKLSYQFVLPLARFVYRKNPLVSVRLRAIGANC